MEEIIEGIKIQGEKTGADLYALSSPKEVNRYIIYVLDYLKRTQKS